MTHSARLTLTVLVASEFPIVRVKGDMVDVKKVWVAGKPIEKVDDGMPVSDPMFAGLSGSSR